MPPLPCPIAHAYPSAMFVLAMDTCFAACSVAVFDMQKGTILAARFANMDKGHAEALPPMVDTCLKEAGVRPGTLSRIAVTRGPGTFTGLRIGLAMAHGLGTALGCEVVGLNSLLATAAPLLAAQSRVLVLHQAGASGSFYGGIMHSGASDGDVRFASPEVCRALSEPGLPMIGTGVDGIPGLAGIRLTGYDIPCAEHFIRLAARLPAAAQLPQPLYLREPDAKPTAAHMPPVELRPAAAGDVPALSRLHRMCFEKGWDEKSLAAALTLPGSAALVAQLAGEIRAFVQYQVTLDEAEIHTICTEPRWRNRRLAFRLLDQLLAELRVRGVAQLHLEVAADNSHAQALYRRFGFEEKGRRKGYYARAGGPVDALLMARRI